jgi:hypothetical protein
MITVRTAIAGIAAIVVLVFAGAGAGTLFSSNSSAVASASPRRSSCPPARGSGSQLLICRLRASLAPLRGALGMALQRRFQMRGTGGVAGSAWGMGMRGCAAAGHVPGNLFRAGDTLASQLAHKRPKTRTAIPPVVAQLFGGAAGRADTHASGSLQAKARGAYAQIRPCATPVPMNHLPRAGSPGRGWAPPTSSSQRRG